MPLRLTSAALALVLASAAGAAPWTDPTPRPAPAAQVLPSAIPTPKPAIPAARVGTVEPGDIKGAAPTGTRTLEAKPVETKTSEARIGEAKSAAQPPLKGAAPAAKPVADARPERTTTVLRSRLETAQARPRPARQANGAGSLWRTAGGGHAFSGSFGGCRFTGFAGPNGYRIDRAC